MDYIVPTEEFIKWIEGNPHQKKVENKIEELKSRKELIPNFNGVSQYSERGWIVKWKGKFNARILLQQQKYDEFPNDKVYFLRRFYDPSQYEDKWRGRDEDKVKDGTWFDENHLTSEEILAGKNAIQGEPPPPPPPFPSEDMVKWLNEFRVEYDFCIYESQMWLNFSDSSLREDEAFEYIKILISLVNNNSTDIVIENINCTFRNLYKATYNNISIIYEDPELQNNDRRKIILLHFAGNDKRDIDIIHNAIEALKSQKLHFQNGYTIEDISNISIKAYPYFSLDLNDRKKWLSIQKNSISNNLSLSPDQIKLLNQFTFPKFINGQAGSGKTTMLFYIFAEIFLKKQLGEFSNDIIYLTENPYLLEKAKEELGELLIANSRYEKLFDENELTEFKKNNFSSFDDLLYYRLIDEEEQEKFLLANYIDFKKFKELYKSSHLDETIKKKYSPELIWFIIITFIKGYSIEKDEISIEEFKENKIIPSKDKLRVDNETYAFVFQKVWSWYKKLTNSGTYWDRQDLVRYILKSRRKLSKKFLVIFSDESQDFTKVELQLLFKLSEFSKYDLSKTSQIPLLFAGDPFQTVNPTGFNLSNIKRMFYTELKESLGFPLNTDSFVNNLLFNHRSSKGIVNLANFIQFFRYKYLKIDDLVEPQKSKFSFSSDKPKYLYLNSINKNDLEEKIKYDVIIVPCEKGEENEYSDKSDHLSENYNVQSPVTVKGNEYPRVILFEFGRKFLNDFGSDVVDKLIKYNFELLEPSLQFELSYFFNKLYVGVTRARETLVIMDSSEAIESFWKKLNCEKILTDINILPKWKEELLKNKDGEIDQDIFVKSEVIELTSSDISTAKKNAQTEKENATILKDPDKMAIASRIYRFQVKDIKQADYCSARELEYRGYFSGAGRLFKKYNYFVEATQCFWVGGCWEDILQIPPESTSEPLEIYITVSKFMKNNSNEIYNLYKKCEVVSNILKKEIKTLRWRKEFDNKLLKDTQQELKNQNLTSIDVLIKITDLLVENCDEKFLTLADLYYENQNYVEAISCWDQIDKNDHKNYYEARLKIAKDDDSKVFYLNKLKRYYDIVTYHRNNPTIKDKDLILNAYIKENLFEELILSGDLFDPSKLINQLKYEDSKISNFISIVAKCEKEGKIEKQYDYNLLILYSVENILKPSIVNEIRKKGGLLKIERDKFLLIIDIITLLAYSTSIIDDKYLDTLRGITNLLFARYKEVKTKLSIIELLFVHEKWADYSDMIKKQMILIKEFKNKKTANNQFDQFKMFLLLILYKENVFINSTKTSPSTETIGEKINPSILASKNDEIFNESSLLSIKEKYFRIVNEIENTNASDYDINVRSLKDISSVSNAKEFYSITFEISDLIVRKPKVSNDLIDLAENETSSELVSVNGSLNSNNIIDKEYRELKQNYLNLKHNYDLLTEKHQNVLEENNNLLKEIIKLKS